MSAVNIVLHNTRLLYLSSLRWFLSLNKSIRATMKVLYAKLK